MNEVKRTNNAAERADFNKAMSIMQDVLRNKTCYGSTKENLDAKMNIISGPFVRNET